jgi:hypothetical protein
MSSADTKIDHDASFLIAPALLLLSLGLAFSCAGPLSGSIAFSVT